MITFNHAFIQASIHLTSMASLESPINPSSMFWMVGGRQSTSNKPMQTQGEHAVHTG